MRKVLDLINSSTSVNKQANVDVFQSVSQSNGIKFDQTKGIIYEEVLFFPLSRPKSSDIVKDINFEYLISTI